MITLPTLPSFSALPSLPSMPSVDVSWLQLPSVHLPKVALPKVDLPKVELPKIDLPTVELPTFDLPAIDMARLQPVVDGVRAAIDRNSATVTKVADRAVEAGRDGAYAALGLGVVATQQLVKAAKQATEKATTAVGSLTKR